MTLSYNFINDYIKAHFTMFINCIYLSLYFGYITFLNKANPIHLLLEIGFSIFHC